MSSNYGDLTPDHRMGFTYKYLEEHLSPSTMDNLMRWMWGQTMAIDEDGGTIIYAVDVERFLNGKRIID